MLARLFAEDAAAERKSLTVPADPSMAGKLAARYRSAELGDIDVVQNGATTWFDVGGWKSEVATRHDEDGAVSFVTIAPSVSGLEFAVADKDNKRSLILRDEQREYVFAEVE
ncbi:MAG: hypothetical protein ACREPE_07325 [Lysobacter sp.]